MQEQKGKGRKFHIKQHWKEIRQREDQWKTIWEKQASPSRKKILLLAPPFKISWFKNKEQSIVSRAVSLYLKFRSKMMSCSLLIVVILSKDELIMVMKKLMISLLTWMDTHLQLLQAEKRWIYKRKSMTLLLSIKDNILAQLFHHHRK